MEKSCLSLSMRFPPPIIRTFVSPLYPIPISSLFFSNKTHKFSTLIYSSSSCALAIESENKKIQIYSEFREKPSNFRKNPQNLSEFNEKPINFWGSGVLQSKLGTKKNRNLGIRTFNGKLTVKWCSEKLKNCASNLLLNEGREIHGRIIKIGLETDMHFWVSLINFYAKCGCLDFARKVLDGMSERDVVSWTALIGGFVANGYGLDSVLLFREMQREGITPNEFTLATVLKAISMCSELYIGKQVHAFVVKLGEFSDIYLGSSLVDLYSKCGDMDYAKKVFVRIPELNVVSWNALLNGYAKRGDKDKMMRILWDMNKSNIKLSEYNLSTVIEGLANSGDLLAGEVVHCVAIKMGFELDEFVSSTLVDLYSKCGIASHALKVFKRIRSPDIVAWTSMISCLDQQGHKQEALKLFCLMTDAGLRPNQYTLASLISAAIDSNLKICKSIHACVYKYAFEAENVVCNAMITMYMKNGSIHYGRLIFDKMSYRDVISWNALLSGFHNCEICDQGPKIFNQMLLEGFKPNSYTFISVLRCCSSLRNICSGKQLHACIIKGSFVEDEFVGTALLDMYAKCNKLECAELVFDRLKCRDLFTWTVIISCYAQNDEGEKAIRSLMEMQKEGANPNEFTLASCLRACAGISSLENGRLLHSWAIKSGHVYDIFVGSSVIDMYGKCGCIEDAESFFEALDFRDAVAWNTIICGYSQHGFGYKSLQSFKAMLDEGILPDKITFLGILSACSHVGLIEEGKKYFNSMEGVYGVVPSVEHYACMIDILGRGGQFDELDTFIKDMKTEPDALIWETVLGACKIHGNLELGKRAAEKVFALEPEIDSNYILLSNIFAAKGNWVDVSKVRALMSSHGVKKEPGCSWVSVDNKTHVFLSQDSSHPMRMEIYKRLEELGEKLDTAGYSPDTNYVFHDMNDREKKENMLHHSEKLALAFALISHSPCKTIRIFKNLRICRDCHEFMKLASRITNREIVVRDIKRFHHFQDGNCTCADYW